MIETYIGGANSLVKYSLTSGIEVELSSEDLEELLHNSYLQEKIKSLTNQNQKLSIKNEYYKELLQSFNSILKKMGDIKWVKN